MHQKWILWIVCKSISVYIAVFEIWIIYLLFADLLISQQFGILECHRSPIFNWNWILFLLQFQNMPHAHIFKINRIEIESEFNFQSSSVSYCLLFQVCCRWRDAAYLKSVWSNDTHWQQHQLGVEYGDWVIMMMGATRGEPKCVNVNSS